MAGAALALVCTAHAHAQTARTTPGTAPAAPPAPVATATTPGPDGLVTGELYMEADEVIREDKIGRTTAQGNIEVRYNGRTLRSDRMVYDEKAGTIRAFGHVEIIG